MPADRAAARRADVWLAARQSCAALMSCAALVLLAGRPLQAAPPPAPPSTAITAGAIAVAIIAVREAISKDAAVTVTTPVLSVVAGTDHVDLAVAEPGSRTGGQIRFVLYTGTGAARRRAGRLAATVRVSAPVLRAATALAAGHAITAAMVAASHGDIGRQRLAPLPAIGDIIGAAARRAVAQHEVLGSSSVSPRTLVHSGDEVVTVARVGGVEIRGRAVAAQSGAAGTTVIVVNPDSRKRLRARVVTDALVEVLHVS